MTSHKVRERAGITLLTCAAVACAMPAVALVSGGFRIYIAAVPLSVRGVHRDGGGGNAGGLSG